MKLTKEQFEDILTTGEAKSAAENKEFKVHLVRESPKLNKDVDTTKTFRYLGYIFFFTPGTDFAIKEYWDTQTHGEDTWSDAEAMDWNEPLDDFYSEALPMDFLISYKGQRYASWDPFAKTFGITELVTFATKIPRPVATRFQRVCESDGETPSWRIRLLIQEYLMENIKDRARQVLFEG